MGSIGRTDLERGNGPELIRSLTEKLIVLPVDTTVLPGHGPKTSIGFEKANNPYIQ
jgi:glyoxylase-like metal-dependent hydrolase (beta-lactamase superfamily II)